MEAPNIKEVEIVFQDGSYYIIRPDNEGDTITGDYAHKVMFAMSKHYNYVNQPFQERLKFITSIYKQ